jgi:predicted enzyme related to lactoylglutathione lyase
MSARVPGEFCWINILTSNVEEAKAFYTAVLGWTYGEIPGMGWSILVNGKGVGGLFDAQASTPQVGVMVRVESADATALRVRAAGGQAMDPFDIGPNGRMSVCHDPNGAQIDLWQPLGKPGMEVDSRAPGAPTWFETETTDTARAAKFYADVFGWTTQAMPHDYTVFQLGDLNVGGMQKIGEGSASGEPHWATYVTVVDAAQAVAEAVRLGGAVRRPIHHVDGVGQCASLTSPQGVPFALIQYA